MASRFKLHEELCELLGSRNVYYQPPASVKLQYPGIRYALSTIDVKRADNQFYSSTNRYQIIVIDQDPDSDIHNKILRHFKRCSFNDSYVADNLNHKVLTLYY